MRRPFTRVVQYGAAVLWLFIFRGSGSAATSQLRPWLDYRTILWISDSAYQRPEKVPLFFQRLREMGINTAMVHGDGNLRPLLDNRFPYYVENMVNKGLCLKFSSNVRDWDKFISSWAQGGRPQTAFVRDYCFEDPQWSSWARREVQSLVRKNMMNAPFAYDIRDELSTTFSANPFDYDFNPLTLSGFREWLKTEYTNSLDALNTQWETKFASWNEVKPFSTDEIKNRMVSGDNMIHGKPDWQAVQKLKFDPVTARKTPTRWNLSPWCDFRTYMDISLARTLADLRDAAHAIDPHTPVGIEGTQMPSAFGGYDLWRLSQSVDWMEPYDIGNAREILGSFMPGKPMMTTVFEKDAEHARRRLWHLLLEGDRGCIVWWSEDCIDSKSDNVALTAKGKALAPVLKEMTSPLAQLFLRAVPERDPIFIHYSQSSIQVDWLLESTPDGSTWARRFSSFEAEHNRMARSRNGWLKLFQDLGYSPQFVRSLDHPSIEDKLTNGVLALPATMALSDQEIAGASLFVQSPRAGTRRSLFYDGSPAEFDVHGRLRATNSFAAQFPMNVPAAVCTYANNLAHGGATQVHTDVRSTPISAYPMDRLKPEASPEWVEWAESHMELPRRIRLPASAHTRIHRFRISEGRLVAFERNVDYHMSEDLKQAGGNEALEKPAELDARLDRPAHVYDLRSNKYLGLTDHIHFTLDPWQPSLFALLEKRVPEGGIPLIDRLVSPRASAP
ncbi:MAG: hypothetical protein QOF48_2938 [Verrucomicrobiota bacterium]|jgi:hypothetical protein